MCRSLACLLCIVFCASAEDDAADHSAELKSELEKALHGIDEDGRDRWKEVIASWTLPDPATSFQDVFGSRWAPRLAREYGEQMKSFADTQHLGSIKEGLAYGVLVERADRLEDYRDIVKAMRRKIPLYSVTLTTPQGRPGTFIGVFVRLDGAFRRLDGLEVLFSDVQPCRDNLVKLAMMIGLITDQYSPPLELADLDLSHIERDPRFCGTSPYVYLYPFRDRRTPQNAIVIYDSQPHASGDRNVLTYDGMSRMLSEKDLNETLVAQSKTELPLLEEAVKAAKKEVEALGGEEKKSMERRVRVLEARVAQASRAINEQKPEGSGD